MNTNYQLIDGVERGAKNPDTWHVPPESERRGLTPGQFAKIGVESKDHTTPGERFWVIIRGLGDGCYLGEINNDLVYTEHHDLACGQEIAFEHQNVLDTHVP